MQVKILHLDVLGGVTIRGIAPADLENLRAWKNANRIYFFHQQEIEPLQQQQWYVGYTNRPNDYMFVVEAAGLAIGCMGIRLLGNGWDVYNVILGVEAFARRGFMSRAFQRMLQFAREQHNVPIGLNVLKRNPAVGWYQKNGFYTVVEEVDHFKMSHADAS